MLKIRLQRVGKKKKPAYRFVVSESSKDMYGKHLEILGHYDPFTKICEVKKDRIQDWISVGAQPSPTVHNLLVDQNVIDKPKVVASKGKKKSAKGGSSPEANAPLEHASGGKKAAEGVEAPVETPAADKPAEEAKTEEKVEESKAGETAVEEPAEAKTEDKK